MYFLMNLCPEMKVVAHLHFSVGSRRPREAQAEARGHSGGLKTVEVPRQSSSLLQRPEDGEGTRLEVYQMHDVAGWTRVLIRGAWKYL
jgi:hypothetical protein